MKTKELIQALEIYSEIIQTEWFQALTSEEQYEIIESGYLQFLIDVHNNVAFVQ